jgi:hypothetical protein
MSFGKPQVNNPAPAPAPVSQGADALQVGGDAMTRQRGAIGRLALRVGGSSGSSGTLGK